MQPDKQPEPNGFLYMTLTNGLRPFMYRSGIYSLLGVTVQETAMKPHSRSGPPIDFVLINSQWPKNKRSDTNLFFNEKTFSCRDLNSEETIDRSGVSGDDANQVARQKNLSAGKASIEEAFQLRKTASETGPAADASAIISANLVASINIRESVSRDVAEPGNTPSNNILPFTKTTITDILPIVATNDSLNARVNISDVRASANDAAAVNRGDHIIEANQVEGPLKQANHPTMIHLDWLQEVKLPPPEAVACFVGQAEPAPKQEEQYCSHLPSYSTGGASGFHVQTTGSVDISSPMCQYVMNPEKETGVSFQQSTRKEPYLKAILNKRETSTLSNPAPEQRSKGDREGMEGGSVLLSVNSRSSIVPTNGHIVFGEEAVMPEKSHDQATLTPPRYFINRSSSSGATERIGRVRNATQQLASRASPPTDQENAASSESDKQNRLKQEHDPLPPVYNNIIIRQPAQRSSMARVFWDRSSLRHFRLRLFR
jgi:hypothetical protein